jgi:alkylation response protein AidB-like acyl-CoA dehydrogenase
LSATTWNPVRPNEPGLDAVWAAVGEAGWFEALVPEARGGLGLSVAAAGAIAEEAGATLLPGPLLETMAIAAQVDLADKRGVVRRATTAGIAGGAGGVETETGFDEVALIAGSITGLQRLVSFGAQVETLLVAATAGSRRVLLLVPARQAGVRAIGIRSADPVAFPADIHLQGAEAERVIAEDSQAIEMAGKVETLLRVLYASRLLGVCRSILDLTVAYAKERVQFDRPIGSFQAIQHILADMAAALHGARNVCYMAQAAVDAGRPDADAWTMVAKAYLARTALRMSEAALQVHGGIGYTADSPLHLYYKHALTLRGAGGGEYAIQRTLARRRLADASARVGRGPIEAGGYKVATSGISQAKS